MCKFPSACITQNKRILWDKDIHSHSELAEKHGFSPQAEDTLLKLEWNLLEAYVHIDTLPYIWSIKDSHLQAAEDFFKKLYGTPEKLIKQVKKLNPSTFIQWVDLADLLTTRAQTKLSPCLYQPRQYQRPCPHPYRRPCRYPPRCWSLPKREHLRWSRTWKKEWIELYSDERNRRVKGA